MNLNFIFAILCLQYVQMMLVSATDCPNLIDEVDGVCLPMLEVINFTTTSAALRFPYWPYHVIGDEPVPQVSMIGAESTSRQTTKYYQNVSKELAMAQDMVVVVNNLNPGTINSMKYVYFQYNKEGFTRTTTPRNPVTVTTDYFLCENGKEPAFATKLDVSISNILVKNTKVATTRYLYLVGDFGASFFPQNEYQPLNSNYYPYPQNKSQKLGLAYSRCLRGSQLLTNFMMDNNSPYEFVIDMDAQPPNNNYLDPKRFLSKKCASPGYLKGSTCLPDLQFVKISDTYSLMKLPFMPHPVMEEYSLSGWYIRVYVYESLDASAPLQETQVNGTTINIANLKPGRTYYVTYAAFKDNEPRGTTSRVKFSTTEFPCECPARRSMRYIDTPVSELIVKNWQVGALMTLMGQGATNFKFGISSSARGQLIDVFTDANPKLFDSGTWSLSLSWFSNQCCDQSYFDLMRVTRNTKSEYRAVIDLNDLENGNVLSPGRKLAKRCLKKEDERDFVCAPKLELRDFTHNTAKVKIPFWPYATLEEYSSTGNSEVRIAIYDSEKAPSPLFTLPSILSKDVGKEISIENLELGTEYYIGYEVVMKGVKIGEAAGRLKFVTSGVSCDVGPESMNCVAVTHDPARYKQIVITVRDFSDPFAPFPVYGADNVLYNSIPWFGKPVVDLKFLTPGTNYSIDWKLRDSKNVDISATQIFTTTCSCSNSDSTPKSEIHSLVQKRGRIYFEFFGDSLCGEAYAFSRSQIRTDGTFYNEDIFAPNYFYYRGRNAECPTFYAPGEEAADDMRRSGIQVGESYRYSIRAVGKSYQGKPLYITHIAQWEASIAGYIGLDPKTGNVPSQGVSVSWVLYDLDGNAVASDKTETGLNGKFSVSINEPFAFTNTDQYRMTLQFSKTTEMNETHTIDHQFACHGGNVDCSSEPLTIYVKHLDFDVPVKVIDTTSVPISGQVYFANTKSSMHNEGCPVVNASVCLVDKSIAETKNVEILCVETSADGVYSLPATIGTKVSIAVKVSGHSFAYMPADRHLDLENGFVVEADATYELNNFEDQTTSQVMVSVAGGLCNRTLGVAKLQFTIDQCLWKGVAKQIVGSYHQQFIVPAAHINVEVEEIVGRTGIKFNSQVVDLYSISQDELDSAIPEVRFEYEGKPVLEVEFDKNLNAKHTCTTIHSVDKSKSDDTKSAVVLPFQTPVRATIYVKRDLGNGVTCDIVDPNLQIRIQNNLGLSKSDPSDAEYREKLRAVYTEEVINLFDRCNDGCLMNVTHDVDPNTNHSSRARVELEFATGRPTTNLPFMKTFVVDVNDDSSESVAIKAVVVGQRKISDSKSVALPTYEPLLVLRDPPGGGSSATYQNIQTTIRVENIGYSEYHGVEDETEASVGGAFESEECKGFGVQVCTKVLDVAVKAGYFRKDKLGYLQDNFKKEAETRGFTTTWSYSTSSNPMVAGEKSDVFVVPNLNIHFSLTNVLDWNETTCTVSKSETTTFVLKSPENVPALAFLSKFEIEDVEIPSLKRMIENLKTDIRDNCARDLQKCDENRDLLRVAEDGLSGWQNTLALNEETKRKAKNGELIRPHEWFDKIAAPSLSGDRKINANQMVHNSGFISKQLASNLKSRPKYEDGNGSGKELTTLNMIKFGGGGAVFTYQLNQNQMDKQVKKLGYNYENSNRYSYNGGIFSSTNTFTVVNLEGKTNVGKGISITASHLQTTQKDASTAIGFTLSDPDIGDVFDVNVYIDPYYGTFVFDTKGQSMCPSEKGTTSRVKPFLKITKPISSTVLASDPMVVEVSLTNDGDAPSSFVLDLDRRYPTGGLLFYPFLPLTFEQINPKETVTTRFTITRAVGGAFEYNELRMLAQVGCEAGLDVVLQATNQSNTQSVYLSNQYSNGQGKLVFTQSCPEVKLAGQVAVDSTFVVNSQTMADGNIPIVVRNPMTSFMKFSEAIQNHSSGLQSVQLVYRKLGSLDWTRGQRREAGKLVEIDFASLYEDEYGAIETAWDVSGFSDGEYEMKIQTVCAADGIPSNLNSYSTEIISGFIDKKAPTMLGFPIPHQYFQVGDAIEMEFNKELQCNKPFTFDIDVDIGGTKWRSQQLQIVCESRFLAIRFPDDLSNEIGKELTLTLDQVADKHGNTISKAIVYRAMIQAGSGIRSEQRRQLTEVDRDDLVRMSMEYYLEALESSGTRKLRG